MDVCGVTANSNVYFGAFAETKNLIHDFCSCETAKSYTYTIWDGLCNLTYRVTNFFYWLFGVARVQCGCVEPYKNMVYGSYNQGNVFNRGVFAPAPGRIACTHIAAQAVNHYVNRGHPKDGGEINAILMEGTVKAMRSAGADLPVNEAYATGHLAAHESLQNKILGVPKEKGDLPRFATADEVARFHPEMQDLFLLYGNAPFTQLNRANYAFSKNDFVTALQQMSAAGFNNRTAAVLTSGGASHMVGLTKDASGRVIEATYFDSHGTERSYNAAFALQFRENPIDELAEFLHQKYGNCPRTLNFTPFEAMPVAG